MKKSLLVLGAVSMLALLFAGCKQPTSGTSNKSDAETTVSYTKVTVTGGYAGPSWTVGSDWKSLTIDFAEVPSKMQMVTTADAVKSHESWGDAYYETYSGAIEATSATVVVDTELTALQALSNDVTKVTYIGIKDMGAADGVAKIVKVTATKTDDTTEELTVPTSDWGYTLSSND